MTEFSETTSNNYVKWTPIEKAFLLMNTYMLPEMYFPTDDTAAILPNLLS